MAPLAGPAGVPELSPPPCSFSVTFQTPFFPETCRVSQQWRLLAGRGRMRERLRFRRGSIGRSGCGRHFAASSVRLGEAWPSAWHRALGSRGALSYSGGHQNT